MADPISLDLTGKLLVAMPGMGDPRFDRSVIFICAHSKDGAMGLIINKPVTDMALGGLLDQLEIDGSAQARQCPVHFGGPVETSRGFVLHDAGYRSRLQTLFVGTAFGMTATLDVLEDIGAGAGPDTSLVMLGYAGWGPGQLENEIARNDWLTAQADPSIVFVGQDDCKWAETVRSLGIEPIALSGSAGRA